MKNNDLFSYLAVGCAVLYAILFAFLPFVAVPFVGYGVSFVTLLPLSGGLYFVLLIMIALAVGMICTALMASKQIAAVVGGVSALAPFIVFMVGRGVAASALGKVGGSVVGHVSSALLGMGSGVILSMIAAIAFLVLVLLSNPRVKTTRTAGLSSNDGDEW